MPASSSPRRSLRRLSGLLLLAATGCGATEPASAGPPAAGADASGDADACGFAVGQRICDLPLVGHVRNGATGLATTEPERTFTFRDVFASGTQRFAFIHTSAYW